MSATAHTAHTTGVCNLLRKRTASVASALWAMGLASVVLVAGCSSTSSAATSSAAGASGVSVSSATTLSKVPTPVLEKSPATLSTVLQRTKPVPVPGGGNINETVKASAISTAPTLPLTGVGRFGTGITATVVKAIRVTAIARLAGEVSGPAVAVTLSVRNGSSRPSDLSQVVVTVADHAGLPASPIGDNGSDPLVGTLAVGKSASGVYVFSLPAKTSNPLTISVMFSTTAPVVLFVGDPK